MASRQWPTFKAIAVGAVGLASFAGCAPAPEPDHSATATAVSSAAAVAVASVPAITTTDDVQPSPLPDLLLPAWITPEKGSASDNTSETTLEEAAKLFGITAEQMTKLKFEAAGRELAEPIKDAEPNVTNIERDSDDIFSLGVSSLESKKNEETPDVFAKTKYERQTLKRLKRAQSLLGFGVGLLNGTPYQWQLMNVTTKHIDKPFIKKFPEIIEPGMPITAYARSVPNSHGEIRYRLLGTNEEMWFTLKMSSGYPHRVTVEYGGALETVGLGDDGKRGSTVDLGVDRGADIATFILTGAEGRFYANDAPANWMNAMMQDIGTHTLRDVLLPRSHHSGMYTVSKRWGLGMGANSVTQDYSIYEQLKVGGVRVLDYRPVMYNDTKWNDREQVYAHHGAVVLENFHGVLGVEQESMIRQINQFNDDYPGELIIIDIHGAETRDAGNKFKTLIPARVAEILESLKGLKHRAVLVPGQDMSTIPLSSILRDGKSAVVVRVEEWSIRGVSAPGPAEGFITPVELPLRTRWSDTSNSFRLMRDQVEVLRRERKDGAARPVFNSDLILTMRGLDLLIGRLLTEMNMETWTLLLREFWYVFRGNIYPNWLTMDAIRDGELRGVAMTVNQCFVAKRCGTLGGRVDDAPPFVLNNNTQGS